MKLIILLTILAACFASTTSTTATAIYPCPPFGISRLPHSTSCDRFIQCFAGEAIERGCGPGLQYSQTDEKCMEPELVQCYRPQCPLFNDPSNLVYLPDYLECDKYYLCHDNEPVAYRCAEGLHWDEKNEHCTTPAEAECEVFDIVCRPNETHNVPNPRFCDQFYYCLFGNSFPSTCPGGLLFDVNMLYCNEPDVAVCYPGSIRP